VKNVALTLLCGSLAGCAPQEPAKTAKGASSPAFSTLVDQYFAAKFAFEPSGATAAGFHELDDKLEDRSLTRIRSRVAELKTLRDRLHALDRGALAFDDAIDAEALENQANAELLDLETLAVWETNPMLYAGLPGAAIDVLMKRNFAPAPDRLRRVTARLGAIAALYAAARDNVRDPPREFTDLAVRLAKGEVGFFSSDVPKWAHAAAAGDAKLESAFAEANQAALSATKTFVTWLTDDLLPRSRGSFAIGAENFRAKLHFEEMVDEPLDRLLARGEAQLAKDHAAFVATARAIDPKGEPGQVMKQISSEHPSAEDLIPSVARSLESAREFLVARDLVTFPSEVRPRVEPTPPYERSGTFASMDTPGPYEKRATEAFYYVTPVEPDWDDRHREEHLRLFNRYVVALINVHEAYPGHYLQFLYSPKFPTKTRKLVAVGTNVEGWAHYAEQMMVDQGFGGGDPKIRLAQLQEALLRDCRYVVGIKLHTQGMTVEQGTRVFMEQAFEEQAVSFEEARRGAWNPTYLYYTLGKLEIQKLRDDYQRRYPDSKVKAFHTAFVEQGGLPIPLVRRLLFR
jgi:uncharacterized protein (DUF885 family)